jgi:hypothetical protein
MSKWSRVLTVVAVVAFLGGVARAELVSFSSDASIYSWSPSGAVVTNSFSLLGPVAVTMNAEAHSKLTLTSTATNETGFVWTGFVLNLDPQENATFVAGSAGSTKFNTVLYPDLYTIEFQAPQVVNPGQVVTVQFDVDIPDGAPFKISLTQTPIPEPATVALLALGAGALLFKRRSSE